ncbi:aminotransferase DegT [Desulfocarbo indianensis]|nr:aminotransferase DegT [Desulfocarbo indianensis]
MDTGWVSSAGEFIPRFEEQFAAFCGSAHGVSAMNGTCALHLALAVLGLGPGDEVLVPSLTFVATANAVSYTGAKPVFVDSEAATWNLDPARLEAAITPRSKAAIVVHLYGHPADMAAIMAIARRHDLTVIEDAAEAHGAEALLDGAWRRVGSMGRMGCFSFYGNKILTTGEGGMLVTDDAELAQRAFWLRDHAMDKSRPYWHPEIGFNYRMTNLQAALGLGQLERVEEILAGKLQVARLYAEGLAGVRGLQAPPAEPWAKSVYWMYSVLVNRDFPLSRDQLRQELLAAGIDTRPFFHPLHTLPPYAKGQRLPVCEDLAQRGLNLPSGPAISPEEIARVCQVIRGVAERS